jgi:hypothetical protein
MSSSTISALRARARAGEKPSPSARQSPSITTFTPTKKKGPNRPLHHAPSTSMPPVRRS